jgi:hypothetical protein
MTTLPGDLTSPTAGKILFLGGWLVETRVIVLRDGAYDTTGVIVGSTGGPSRMVWSHLAETGDTLVDLTSDANGGVLLGMLAATGRLVSMWPVYVENGWVQQWCVGVRAGQTQQVQGATLAEAVARALVAIGRCS